VSRSERISRHAVCAQCFCVGKVRFSVVHSREDEAGEAKLERGGDKTRIHGNRQSTK
jgi:hypothetical protein